MTAMPRFGQLIYSNTFEETLGKKKARDIEQGLPPGNRLDPTWLSKAELRSIRGALRQASTAPEHRARASAPSCWRSASAYAAAETLSAAGRRRSDGQTG